MRRRLLALLLVLAAAPSPAQDSTELPAITVTATRSERTLFETPRAVSVINAQAIREAAVTSTPDLLLSASGAYVQKTNLGGGSPFLRGFTGKQVLILIDGVRLNNSFYRSGPHQYLNTVDPALLERIEVLRGPGSVLYGTDALGGVINLITRELPAAGAAGAGLRVLGDSAVSGGALGSRVEYGGKTLSFSGGASGKWLNDLHAGDEADTQSPSGYNEYSGDVKVGGQLWGGALSFSQQMLRARDVPKTSEVTLGPNAQFNYEPQARWLSSLDYTLTDAGFADALRLNLSYHVQEEGEEIIRRATPDTESTEVTKVSTPGASAQFTSQWGAQRWTYGFEYYRDTFDSSKVETTLSTGAQTRQAPGAPDGAHYDSLGIYAQDEYSFSQASDLIAGVRYSYFDTDGQAAGQAINLTAGDVTGSLHVLHRLSGSWNLFGGVAQGFRAPNIEDFFGRVDFVSEIPNTELKPESSLGFEAGVKFARRGGGAGEFLVYRDEYEDLIDRVTVSPGVQQRRNVGRARVIGSEASYRQSLNARWSVAGNLTYTRGENLASGAPLRRIPPLNGTLSLRGDLSPRLWLEAWSWLAAKQDRLAPADVSDPRIGPNGTPGYAVFGLKTGYAPGPAQSWTLVLENLTDARYKSHGSGLFAPGLSLRLGYEQRFAF